MSPAATDAASACSAVAPFVVAPELVAAAVVVGGDAGIVVPVLERPPDPQPADATARLSPRTIKVGRYTTIRIYAVA
jgi:hypothetical protein